MKILLKIGFNALLLLSMASCSTTPVSTKDSKLIGESQILEDGKKLLTPSKNTGEIIVKRDSGIFGGACATLIYIDGKSVAEIDTSEKAIFYLPEGEHFIGAEPSGICVGGLAEVIANVKAGSTLVFRYGIMGNGNSGIYPTSN